MTVSWLLLLSASLAFSQGLPLQSPTTAPLTVSSVIERVESLEGGLKSFSADFDQVMSWQGAQPQSLSGTVDFQRPNLLRMEHSAPEPQTLVADGQWLWIHRRSTNQVIQTKFEDWKKSEPLAQGLLDFGNYSRLLRSYDVTLSSVQPAGADGHRRFSLVLKPRGKAADFSLTLNLSTRVYFPMETELRSGDVTVRSVFKNIRYNPAHPKGHFSFTPPKGADVFKKS